MTERIQRWALRQGSNAARLICAAFRALRADARSARLPGGTDAHDRPGIGRVARISTFVCSILALAAATPAASGGNYLTRPQALEAAFPGARSFAPVELPREPKAQEELRRASRLRGLPRSIHEARNEHGAVLGWAVERDVIGKSEPITYLLAVNADQRVLSVEILAYRESHGGEIRREAFRKQFVGKTDDSELTLGRDVRNITGATLSCRAITDGVHDDLLALRYVLERKPHDAQADQGTLVEPQRFASSEQGLFRRAQVCMGTQLEITIAGVPHDLAERASSAAFAEARRLDGLLSHFRDDSDVSRIARADSQGAKVAPETYRLLEASKELSDRTLGSFDPCLGAAIQLWRDSVRTQVWPTPEDIRETRDRCGVGLLVLHPDGLRVALRNPMARIDLGGVGKGYALDQMAAVLRAQGVNRSLLNFGGQLLALDPPPGEDGWTVEVGSPVDRHRSLITLSLNRLSVASSGTSEQLLSIGARSIGHIIDPRTLHPVDSRRIATAIAVRAMDADAWSTAAFVLGDDGLSLAEASGVGLLIADPFAEPRTNPLFRELANTTGEALAAPGR
ncbi:MAG: FAD:protein FMN transferase [Planctomycetes bacterium]|nr:FAD:protein FMN transferase [Planctomycetota bacterium]